MAHTTSSSGRTGAERGDEVEAGAAHAPPAKQTLVERAAVQLRPAQGASSAGSSAGPQRAGDWNMTEGLSSALGLGELASQGVANASAPLPHYEAVQRSFGGHDVSGVRAEVGGAAGEASRAIGAEAYATGNRVGFASAPDLHTAAHEAAHVVQQRQGVQLKGGVGEAGDRYEQHADAVADAVVAGRSAEGLLSELAPGGGAGSSAAVQRRPVSQPGSSSAGALYKDDRGPTMMRQVSEGVYEINGTQYNYSPETDQYMNPLTWGYWDPVSNRELQAIQGEGGAWWYASEQVYHSYDGRLYQPYQQEGGGGGDVGAEGGAQQHASSFGSSEQQAFPEPEPAVDYDAMVESEDVTLMTAQQMIQEGLKSKPLAVMIIESTAAVDPRAALIYYRSWNAAYAEVQRIVNEQPAPVAAPSNKRKFQQSKAPQKPAVFAAVTLAECGMNAQTLMEKLQSDRQREARHLEAEEREKKKAKRDLLATIEYNGAQFRVEILSEGGGFYDVYTITDENPIIPGIANNTLVLRIPKTGPNRGIARAGAETHGQLRRQVGVPAIRNEPSRDGFFLVEKIEHEFDVKVLLAKESLAACTPPEQARLEQVRGVLRRNADAQRALVPDFRPANLRFRAEDSPEVVLVDFTDEANIGQETGGKFWKDMKSVVLEFSNYRENHWIYEYLLQGFTEAQRNSIREARVF
jgi:Domain of unknown function (DUF4157)